MKHHFADRLIEKAETTNSFGCLGIDPRPDWSPFEEEYSDSPTFELVLSELAGGKLPAIKPQAAFLGDSVGRMRRLGSIAKRDGVLTIADVKRGDIGTTAEAYAEEWLKSPFDAITVNPYLGIDSLEPFAKAAEREGRGIFVLVRTSNKGAADIQELEVKGGMRVYEHVAQMVNDLGAACVGERGYSNVGAVVGATVSPGIVTRLRELMPRTIFLMPGLGAQGGGVASVRAALDKNNHGVLAPSSRSLNYPWKDKDGKGSAPADWRGAIAKAIEDFKKITAVRA